MAHITTSETYENCCRTCLCDKADVMVDIFKEHNSLNIVKILLSCTSINVKEGDILPKRMCDQCYKCLIAFYEFRKIAQSIDTQLNNYLISKSECVSSIKFESNSMKYEESADDSFTEFEIDLKQEIDTNINNIITCEIDYGDQHKCEICDKTFKNEIKLEQHRAFHSTEKNIAESKIVKEENSGSSSPEIALKNENDSNLVCDVCSAIFKSNNSLNAHKRRHTRKNRVLACSICSKIFKKQSHLKRHELIHSKNRPNKSSVKNTKEFSAPEDINIPDTEQNYVCDVCSASFKTLNSLSGHKQKHTKRSRVLACSICSKQFKKLSHVKRHELTHAVNHQYKCSLCPKTFAIESKYLEHLNKHKGIKNHVCLLCEKSFSHLSTLKTHMSIHTKNLPYLCPTCGKRFHTSNNLNQHIRRHIGLKSFACSLCPKKFVSKGELKSHMQTHTGESACACDQCGVTFTKNSSLKKHKLRHLGIKPHQCDVCSRRFTSKDHLTRHYRIHTGEKPYHCDICDKAYTQSYDLVRHKRLHLGDKLFKCTECTQSFRLKTELRHHVSQHYAPAQIKILVNTSDTKDVQSTESMNDGLSKNEVDSSLKS